MSLEAAVNLGSNVLLAVRAELLRLASHEDALAAQESEPSTSAVRGGAKSAEWSLTNALRLELAPQGTR
jgi:hypothetical protein